MEEEDDADADADADGEEGPSLMKADAQAKLKVRATRAPHSRSPHARTRSRWGPISFGLSLLRSALEGGKRVAKSPQWAASAHPNQRLPNRRRRRAASSYVSAGGRTGVSIAWLLRWTRFLSYSLSLALSHAFPPCCVFF